VRAPRIGSSLRCSHGTIERVLNFVKRTENCVYSVSNSPKPGVK
jgi:hypothetical protein